jgi:hypothetical protein
MTLPSADTSGVAKAAATVAVVAAAPGPTPVEPTGLGRQWAGSGTTGGRRGMPRQHQPAGGERRGKVGA